MALILNIETATMVCSVALAQDRKLISLKEINEGYTHAENLTVFIEDIFKEAGIKLLYQDFKHPSYRQQFIKDEADFMPYMSVLYLLSHNLIYPSTHSLISFLSKPHHNIPGR